MEITVNLAACRSLLQQLDARRQFVAEMGGTYTGGTFSSTKREIIP